MKTSDLWTSLFSTDEKTTVEKWAYIKLYRDKLLLDCHWTQLPDAILSPSEKALWKTYRETLQGLEFAFALPDNVVIPDPPIITSTPQTPEIISARAKWKAARVNAKAIPLWATWTPAEAQTWGDDNIGTPLVNAWANLPATLTLATARAAFIVILNILDQMWILQKAMAQMVLALRDQAWPDLPNTTLK